MRGGSSSSVLPIVQTNSPNFWRRRLTSVPGGTSGLPFSCKINARFNIVRRSSGVTSARSDFNAFLPQGSSVFMVSIFLFLNRSRHAVRLEPSQSLGAVLRCFYQNHSFCYFYKADSLLAGFLVDVVCDAWLLR